MTERDNTNRGALFVNERKRAGKTPPDPDSTGSINVAGVDYWIDGWREEAKTSGKKYLRLQVRPKDAAAKTAPARAPSKGDDPNVPF